MRAVNEAVAIRLPRAFGTMWLCHAFAVLAEQTTMLKLAMAAETERFDGRHHRRS